jgi:hypothetical protein
LRDLSNLQHRLGDYQGMSESRSKMMIASPIMLNWISFLFSVYMAKDYKQTLEVLDSIFDLYETTE